MKISDKAQKLIESVPCRKFRGELVPYVDFKETIRLLSTYSCSDKELDLFAGEINRIKQKIGVAA